jgi:SMC interacting uncharacterized protein involved in chromosome segregation
MQGHELDRALGRVEGKVDGLEHSIHEIKSMLQESHKDITKRVSSLEHSRSKLLGTASAIGAAFGVFGGWLTANLLPRVPH